jgi:amino-acid N-acetyltransferase
MAIEVISPGQPAAAALVARKATVEDVEQIQQLISVFAARDLMLHRSLNELFETVRDFSVVGDANRVLACSALHVNWDDLAELKCVAVDESMHGHGLGRTVVESCLREAAQLKLRRVFTLTYQPGFFSKFGFQIVDRNTLPHKVWGECIKCHKFPDCQEVAMMYYVNRGRAALS